MTRTTHDIEDAESILTSTASSSDGSPSNAHVRTASQKAVPKGCSGCSCASKPVAGDSNALLGPISTSTFELFKIGIGPSSSHTVGPLLACRSFCRELVLEGTLQAVARLRVELCGSLALTGIGHCTNKAVILGLTGVSPADVDTTQIESFLKSVTSSGTLKIGFDGDFRVIRFNEDDDVILIADELPLHPNGMVCQALDEDGNVLKEVSYYSIGGGFIMTEAEMLAGEISHETRKFPFPYSSMSDLVRTCESEGLSIADVMRRNEEVLSSAEEVESALEAIWSVMEACVDKGLSKDKAGEELPGPLGVVRRAPDLYSHAQSGDDGGLVSGLMDEMAWLHCYALAVMEENATMGRVVTAPTNGAAGVVPATLTYYMRHLRHKQPEHRRHSPSTFLLAAAAVGILAKERACISGAAGGCQAEVGTATAMAAAGLCAVLGGTPEQVEEAAEVAMEHSLGMTCDPVLGLVQVPCIERNAVGATRALNAVTLVLKAPKTRRRATMSYDRVLHVMKETGKDISSKYRETAQGGLAAEYEAKMQEEPEKWQEIQEMMGIKRIQAGPRRRARILSYEEASSKGFMRNADQEFSLC